MKKLKRSKPKRILFLYTELSGYIVNCLGFAEKDGYNIHVVKYPLNNEAPFNFEPYSNINLYERESFKSFLEFKELVVKLNPELIFISGWIDKWYLKIVKSSSIYSKNILMIDTPWKNSIKQKLWSHYFSLCKKRYFDYVWIPGQPQYKYAKKLGFRALNIFKGLYTCDEEVFNKTNTNNDNNSKIRTFLYVGRYVKEKGIIELWQTFQKANAEIKPKWQLWCVGTGELWGNRIIDENIKHFGFIQPKNLSEIVSKSDVYVMPSKYEPWGVSLHEMISFGKPVLVSENVGSSYCFVKNHINGFVFSYSKKNDFINKMRNMMKLSNNELHNMGKESVHLSKVFSKNLWLDTLNKIYD